MQQEEQFQDWQEMMFSLEYWMELFDGRPTFEELIDFSEIESDPPLFS